MLSGRRAQSENNPEQGINSKRKTEVRHTNE